MNNPQKITDLQNSWALFIAVLLASYFVWGGYKYEESINLIKTQIDFLYKTASQKIFDIYLTEEELKSYRLHPSQKIKNIGVLKPGI